MENLTSRQRDVLDYVKSYIVSVGIIWFGYFFFVGRESCSFIGI